MQKSPAHFFLPVVLLLLALPCFCQNTYTSKDSVRIYELLNNADEFSDVNIDTAMFFARSAYALSIKKKMLRGEGWGLLKIAELTKHSTKQDSIEYLNKAGLEIASRLKDDFMQSLAYLQLGQHYMFRNRYLEAESNYHQSLKVKFEKDQSEYTVIVYNDLGFLFRLKEDFEKEIEWLLKSKKLAEKLNDPAASAPAWANLANAYNNLGNKKEAIKNLWQAITIRHKSGDIVGLATNYNSMSRLVSADSLSKAIHYQSKAMQYAEQSKVKALIAASYGTMAILLSNQKKNQEALDYERKSIEIFRQVGNKNQEASGNIIAADISRQLGDSTSALAFFQNAFDISTQIKSKSLLRDIFFTKTIYFKDRKDYFNAYETFKKYVSYRDSLIQEKTRNNVAELQLKYETEKKDNEIALLNTDSKIRQLESEKQKAIIRGNIYEAEQKEKAIALLNQEKELQKVRLNQQKEELDKQILLTANNEQKIKLLNQDQLLREKQLENQKLMRNSIIAGISILLILFGVLFNRYQLKKQIEQQHMLINFRNDIAKDLHDDIGSTLSSIKILSEVSRSNLAKDQVKAGSYLEKITEQSIHLHQEMSDIVWAIKPDNDRLSNMLVRMREFVNHTLEPKNIRTDFVPDDLVLSSSLDMQQRRDFFLIFKEAINNAAKYSKATNVRIILQKLDGQVLLTITDNGIGFNPEKESSSNGLKNMVSRARILRGTLDIFSKPGEGTTITLKVPSV